MLSALRVGAADVANTAAPALPGTNRARGRRLGSPAAVISSTPESMFLAARHPSSAEVAKPSSERVPAVSFRSPDTGRTGAETPSSPEVRSVSGVDVSVDDPVARPPFSPVSQLTGTERFDRNHAEATSSKIGVVSVMSLGSSNRRRLQSELDGSAVVGTAGANRSSPEDEAGGGEGGGVVPAGPDEPFTDRNGGVDAVVAAGAGLGAASGVFSSLDVAAEAGWSSAAGSRSAAGSDRPVTSGPGSVFAPVVSSAVSPVVGEGAASVAAVGAGVARGAGAGEADVDCCGCCGEGAGCGDGAGRRVGGSWGAADDVVEVAVVG